MTRVPHDRTGPDADAERLLVAELAALAARAEASTDPCPEELALVGFTEGRLVADEVARLERHLARCARCRELVAGQVQGGSQPIERRPAAPISVLRSRNVRRWAAWLAAAAVVALAGWWWRPRPSVAEPDVLVAALQRLTAGDAGLFGSFELLARDELARDPRALERGDRLLGLLPRGTIDATRPRLEWEAPRLAGECEASILDSSGAVVWTQRSAESSMEWPAGQPDLARGTSYLLIVATRTALGDRRGSAEFAVSSPTEQEAAARARDQIAAAVPAPWRDLVLAQWLLQAGRFAEAAAAARAHLEAWPDDADGRLVLFQALARIDSSEADSWR
jgi:hypothetical protein